MKIVVAQHKGGVGKTTLAVHLAAILSTGRFNKTILVDCDSQGDSFWFFTSTFPGKPLVTECGMDDVDVIWNPDREKFSTKASFDEYRNMVVDIDTRVTNALQVIREANPDIVLIPIDNQRLSLEHGKHVIELLQEEEGTFLYPVRVVFVQMGIDWGNEIGYDNFIIPFHEKFDDCFRERDYIWNINDNLEYMSGYFKELVDYVR
ncbi:ParA family protein [Vibrio splendidus]